MSIPELAEIILAAFDKNHVKPGPMLLYQVLLHRADDHGYSGTDSTPPSNSSSKKET